MELLYLPNLRTLVFRNNQFRNLPDEIQNLELKQLEISGNNLCDIPELLNIWLMPFNESWKEQQMCGNP